MKNFEDGHNQSWRPGPPSGAGGARTRSDDGHPDAHDCMDALRRLQADFENYRKRVRRQQGEEADRGVEELIERLLPVLDAFELGLRHEPDAVGPLYASLWAVLEAQGLERLDPAGKPFDPSEHEAVVHDQAAGGSQMVSEVLRPGYRYKGRLLRPAMVKVSGAREEVPGEEVRANASPGPVG